MVTDGTILIPAHGAITRRGDMDAIPASIARSVLTDTMGQDGIPGVDRRMPIHPMATTVATTTTTITITEAAVDRITVRAALAPMTVERLSPRLAAPIMG